MLVLLNLAQVQGAKESRTRTLEYECTYFVRSLGTACCFIQWLPDSPPSACLWSCNRHSFCAFSIPSMHNQSCSVGIPIWPLVPVRCHTLLFLNAWPLDNDYCTKFHIVGSGNMPQDTVASVLPPSDQQCHDQTAT